MSFVTPWKILGYQPAWVACKVKHITATQVMGWCHQILALLRECILNPIWQKVRCMYCHGQHADEVQTEAALPDRIIPDWIITAASTMPKHMHVATPPLCFQQCWTNKDAQGRRPACCPAGSNTAQCTGMPHRVACACQPLHPIWVMHLDMRAQIVGTVPYITMHFMAHVTSSTN